jgi:hypothetical protein
LEKLNGANSATSQTEMQSNHEQNYKQKSTAKVPTFRSFQTSKNCNLTNRITIKLQTEGKKREKEKKEAKKRIKSKRKI